MNRENQHEIPEIRTCYRMTNLREYLVISVGGDCRSSATYNDLWIYNTISGMWKHNQPIIELGTICEYSEIYSFGNKVYIFGYDHLYKPHRKIPCLVSFNVIDTNWETVYIHNEDKDENEPPYMCVNLFYYHNKSLYVLGTLHRDDISINSNYSDENDSSEDSTNIESENSVVMYKFCLVTSTWTLVQQTGVKPIFYGQAYATVFNNQLFMFCRESTATTKFREVNIFDLSTNIWARRETKSKNQQYPYTRVGESYAFSSNCAFMSGGRTLNNNASYEDIWRIELETLEWIKLDYSHSTRIHHHLTSVVNDSYLFSFRGLNQNCDRLTEMERFTVLPPALYRLCLESLYRSTNMKSLIRSLPAAILDELNLNENDSLLDA